MSTIEHENTEEVFSKEVEELISELCAKTKIQYYDMPNLLWARALRFQEEVRLYIEERVNWATRDYAKAKDRFAKELSFGLDKLEGFILKQVEGCLENGGKDANAAAVSTRNASELRSKWNAFLDELRNLEGDKLFLDTFYKACCQWTQEINEYAEKCYGKLGVDEISQRIFAKFSTLYNARIEGEAVFSMPDVIKKPYYFLGDYGASACFQLASSPIFKLDPQGAPAKFPVLLKRNNVNIICYDKEASLEKSKASDALSNILFQSLLYQLPDIELHIWDGDTYISSYDGDLSHDSLVKDFMHIYSQQNAFVNEVNRKIQELPENASSRPQNCRLPHIIAILPHDAEERQLDSLKNTDIFRKWPAQLSKGIRLTYVMERKVFDWLVENSAFDTSLVQPDVLALYGSSPFPHAYLQEYCHSTPPDIAPSWKTEEKTLKTNVLRALISPPREIDEDDLVLYFADRPETHTPYSFVYSGENSNTIYLEGMPGAGKSYALKQYILNACENNSPDKLQLIMVDLKGGVELTPFADLPHVQYVISAQGEIINGVFADVLKEMNRRIEVFKQTGDKYHCKCSNIADYKKLIRKDPNANDPPMPRLLVVIDECKSIFEGGRQLRGTLEQLLRQCRSNGIHFLFATQTKQEQFDKNLFEYYVQLKKFGDRRSVTLFEGGAKENGIEIAFRNVGKDNEEKVLGRMRIDSIASRYSSYPRKAIVFDSSSLIDIGNYPMFRQEFHAVCGQMSTSGEVFACAGINFNDIRSVYSIGFSRGFSQNLFIAGNFGKTLDGFSYLFLFSLLYQNCKVSIYDPEGKMSFLRACFKDDANFDYTTESDGFVSQVQEWRKTADGIVSRRHFLFIASADVYMKNAIPPKRGGFAARASFAQSPVAAAKPSGEQTNAGELFARAKTDKAAQKEAFAFMLKKSAPVASSPEEPPKPQMTYQETFAVLLEYISQPAKNGNYLVLQTNMPGMIGEYLQDGDLKNFRFAVFFFSGRGLGSRMAKPEGSSSGGLASVNPIAYFSTTTNTEDLRDVFIALDRFEPGAAL